MPVSLTIAADDGALSHFSSFWSAGEPGPGHLIVLLRLLRDAVPHSLLLPAQH